jgi:hypothetical protein
MVEEILLMYYCQLSLASCGIRYTVQLFHCVSNSLNTTNAYILYLYLNTDLNIFLQGFSSYYVFRNALSKVINIAGQTSRIAQRKKKHRNCKDDHDT